MSQALQQPKGDDTRAELSHGNEATFLVYQFHLPCQFSSFFRAMLCISAAYAVVPCLSVCHVRVLCQKE